MVSGVVLCCSRRRATVGIAYMRERKSACKQASTQQEIDESEWQGAKDSSERAGNSKMDNRRRMPCPQASEGQKEVVMKPSHETKSRTGFEKGLPGTLDHSPSHAEGISLDLLGWFELTS